MITRAEYSKQDANREDLQVQHYTPLPRGVRTLQTREVLFGRPWCLEGIRGEKREEQRPREANRWAVLERCDADPQSVGGRLTARHDWGRSGGRPPPLDTRTDLGDSLSVSGSTE